MADKLKNFYADFVKSVTQKEKAHVFIMMCVLLSFSLYLWKMYCMDLPNEDVCRTSPMLTKDLYTSSVAFMTIAAIVAAIAFVKPFALKVK